MLRQGFSSTRDSILKIVAAAAETPLHVACVAATAQNARDFPDSIAGTARLCYLFDGEFAAYSPDS